MRKVLMGLALFGAGILSGAATAYPLFGPKGEFKSFLGKLEYDPSRGCTKPSKPYSDDSYARQSYISGAKRYLDCLEDAANADVKYATDVIAAGYNEAADDFLGEVKRGY